MTPFPGRNVGVTEAMEALDSLEGSAEYNGSQADMLNIALIRLVLRRQSMMLAACLGVFDTMKDWPPILRAIVLSIRGLAPAGTVHAAPIPEEPWDVNPVPRPTSDNQES